MPQSASAAVSADETRLCRPSALAASDLERLLQQITSKLGGEYGLKNVWGALPASGIARSALPGCFRNLPRRRNGSQVLAQGSDVTFTKAVSCSRPGQHVLQHALGGGSVEVGVGGKERSFKKKTHSSYINYLCLFKLLLDLIFNTM